jgi:hypothetical protein
MTRDLPEHALIEQAWPEVLPVRAQPLVGTFGTYAEALGAIPSRRRAS